MCVSFIRGRGKSGQGGTNLSQANIVGDEPVILVTGRLLVEHPDGPVQLVRVQSSVSSDTCDGDRALGVLTPTLPGRFGTYTG